MTAVGNSVTQLIAELSSLTRQTAHTIGRVWVPVLALMLLGWATQQLSILLATEVSAVWAWGVIVVLAVGAVIQLVTVIAVLRVVAVELGLPKLLADASLDGGAANQRDTSLVSLLTITVLPFLAMYVVFGYLQHYAARVTLLATYRKGFGDLLDALNPMHSPTTMVVTLVLLGVGYALKGLITPWLRRTRYPIAVGVLQVMIEAGLAFVVLLSGFRVYQEFRLWLDGRRVSAWADQFAGLLLGPVPALVKELVDTVWQFVGGQFWPVVVHGLARPLLWLAMAGLVFGSRVLTMADLWRIGRPVTQAATRRQRLLARLQDESSTARGVRTITLRLQAIMASGLDVTVIPAWQSLRLVLRAGWPFLGAFLIGFTALELAGQQLDVWVTWLIGGQLIGVWIALYPFLDLINMVLVMGVTWILLGVAYTRALSIFAAAAVDADPAALLPGTPGIRRSFRAGPAQAITVVVITALVAAGASLLPTQPAPDVVRGDILQTVDLHGQQVAVGRPQFAKAITIGGRTITTDQVFVVVNVMVANPEPKPTRVTATFASGSVTYPTWEFGGTPVATPGFRVSQDVVFEVAPAAVSPGARLAFSTAGTNIAIQGYQMTAEIDLGVAPDALATTQEYVTVSDLPEREAA